MAPGTDMAYKAAAATQLSSEWIDLPLVFPVTEIQTQPLETLESLGAWFLSVLYRGSLSLKHTYSCHFRLNTTVV